MICSRAEAYSLVIKAARGAGLRQGNAEELATAMKIAPSQIWEVLPDALSGEFDAVSPDEIDGRLVYQTSRIAVDGPTAIDAALSGQEVYLGRLDVPLILVMMCHVAEEATQKGFEYIFDEDGGVLLRQSGRAPDGPEIPDGRADIPENVFGFLNILAAKTYVPATEASRVSGAGAGLTDND